MECTIIVSLHSPAQQLMIQNQVVNLSQKRVITPGWKVNQTLMNKRYRSHCGAGDVALFPGPLLESRESLGTRLIVPRYTLIVVGLPQM